MHCMYDVVNEQALSKVNGCGIGSMEHAAHTVLLGPPHVVAM